MTTPEGWSTEDRREALGEALRRWSVQDQHDRITRRDQDLYAMGARNGFTLGAEWWKATHPVAEPQGKPTIRVNVDAPIPYVGTTDDFMVNVRAQDEPDTQGEPSDAQVQAALRAYWGIKDNLPYPGTQMRDMRAALRAANQVK